MLWQNNEVFWLHCLHPVAYPVVCPCPFVILKQCVGMSMTQLMTQAMRLILIAAGFSLREMVLNNPHLSHIVLVIHRLLDSV